LNKANCFGKTEMRCVDLLQKSGRKSESEMFSSISPAVVEKQIFWPENPFTSTQW